MEFDGSVWLPQSDFRLTAEQFEQMRARDKLRQARFRDAWWYATASDDIAETRIAQKLLALNDDRCEQKAMSLRDMRRKWAVPVMDEALERMIDEAETEHMVKLHPTQRLAVKTAAKSNVFILTGGPGTGKTTVLQILVAVLRKIRPDAKISFCAPTGKASARMKEQTGELALTVHKEVSLGYGHRLSPVYLWDDAVIIDETSMLDIYVMDALLKSIIPGTKLIFLGDTDQLPSVGKGAVLRDMLRSGRIPSVRLTHTFRQAAESGILSAIDLIRHGEHTLPFRDDFVPFNVDCSNKNETMIKIRGQYLEQVKRYGLKNVAVLLPTRQKGICSNAVNNMLQAAVNPKPYGYRYTSKDGNVIYFRKDDRCMQTVNRKECVNGEIGEVQLVSEKGVDVLFENGLVHYGPNELWQLSLAYAMTVHKSQGSEYLSVISVMLNEHSRMLERNIPYTAITRAKKECIYIYNSEAHKIAVTTVNSEKRVTLLSEKLEKLGA